MAKIKEETRENGNAHNRLLIIMLALIVLLIMVFKAPEYVEILGRAVLSLQTTAKITIGSQLRLDILASGVTDLAGVQLSIGYNPNVLVYDRIVEGNFLNQNGISQTLFLNTLSTSQPGLLKDISIVKISKGASGDGLIASVYFNATNTGNSDLTLQNVLLSDSSGNPIGTGIINTNVSVAGVAQPNVPVSVLQPVLTITSPKKGSVISGSTVDVRYKISGDLNQVHHVNLQLDNKLIVKDLDLDGFYRFRSVPSGNHTVNAYIARADNTKITGTDASVQFRIQAKKLFRK